MEGEPHRRDLSTVFGLSHPMRTPVRLASMTSPKQDTPPSTRERILSAASDLFLERGYARTSIAKIEQAAGLAPRTGGSYRHFDSKEALLIGTSRGWARVLDSEEPPF